MSRSYFKNDLFHYQNKRQEQEECLKYVQRKKQIQHNKVAKRLQRQQKGIPSQNAPIAAIKQVHQNKQKARGFSKDKKLVDQFRDLDCFNQKIGNEEINQIMKQLKQSKLQAKAESKNIIQQSNSNQNKVKSTIKIFKPQSTLIVKTTVADFDSKKKKFDNPDWEFKKQAQKNWEDWKQKNPRKQYCQNSTIKEIQKLQERKIDCDQNQQCSDKKIMKEVNQQGDQKKKVGQSSGKKKQNKMLSKKISIKQKQSEGQSKQHQTIGATSAPAKTKRIKKVEQKNYVRQNLKNKYVQRFRGQLGRAAKNKKSAKLRVKQKIKSGLKSEFIQQQNGEIYNNYVNSLSQALCLQLTIKDSDEEQSIQDNQNSDVSHQSLLPQFQVPQEISKQAMTPFLNKIFGFQSFREGQYEVIKNMFENRSTLFVAETASGKSLTYLFSSIIMDGLSIVISPLISLLLDQLSHLPKHMPAAIISSLVNFEQRNRILKLVKKGQIKLLFITPQSLQSNDMSYHLRQFPPINFVCIDEAHCLSELSHNFRTSYLVLQEMVFRCFRYKNSEGKPVILCLTATANVETIFSIQSKLNIQSTIRNKSIMNKNLFITVSRQKGQEKFQAIVDYLNHPQIKKCKGTLIYCRTRYLLDKVFNYLRNSGFTLRVFHSAISQKEKVQTLGLFRQNKLRIIATTNALGMGLDFQNLQCIIHLNMPKSIESYVQEIGRAGRRQKRAYCHLFLDPFDFYTERNYILADNLEHSHLKMILDTLKKRTVASLKKIQNSSQFEEGCQQAQKNEIEQDKMSLKRSVDILQQQSKHGENYSSLFQKERDYANQILNQTKKQFGKLAFLSLKTFTEQTFLSKQTLLTILIKIQNLTCGKFLKIHPISFETVKISFFKNNKEKITKENKLFRDFIRDCKNIKGSLYIKLIPKCNELGKDPIELIGDLYELSYKDQNFFKLEFLNQVYVWQYVGKITFTEILTKNFSQFVNQVAEEQQIHLQFRKQNSLQMSQGQQNFSVKDKFKNKMVKKGLNILQSKNSFFNQILYEINELQKVSMTKLNTFYTLGFINSSIRVQSLISRGQILSLKQQLPSQNIVSEFDQYFCQQLDNYYDKLTISRPENRDQTNQAGEYQRVSYLPISQISQQDYPQIQNDVKAFMKHHLFYTVKDVDDAKKSNQIIRKYADGRIISRVFLGVNDSQSNYKIYGEHTYWMKYKDRDHQQLLKAVKKTLRNYLIEEKYLTL